MTKMFSLIKNEGSEIEDVQKPSSFLPQAMPTRDWGRSLCDFLQQLVRHQSFGVLGGVWSQG